MSRFVVIDADDPKLARSIEDILDDMLHEDRQRNTTVKTRYWSDRIVAAVLSEGREAREEERCGCGKPREGHSRATMGHYEPQYRFVTEWRTDE